MYQDQGKRYVSTVREVPGVSVLATYFPTRHTVITKAMRKPWLVSVKFSSTLALLQPADRWMAEEYSYHWEFCFLALIAQVSINVSIISYDLFSIKGVNTDIGPARSVLRTMTQYFNDIRNYTEIEQTFTLSSALGSWYLY